MVITDYVIMPGSDYQAVCDKIREKTGKTGIIKSGDLVTEIEENMGQIIENQPIELDFTNGNQTITAPEGYLVKSAILQKPADLLAENIAEGKDIGGIIGTLAAGGSNVKIACGTTTSTSGTITHNLGVVPDFVLISLQSTNSSTSIGIRTMFGFSSAFDSVYTSVPANVYSYRINASSANSVKYAYSVGTNYIDQSQTSGTAAFIRDANSTTFVFGNTSSNSAYADYRMMSGTKFWLAIGGLV